MTVLSIAQAKGYAQQAGFSGSSLDTFIAVLQGESGLDTQAVNPNDPNGGSFGIAQINGIHFGETWPGGVMTQAAASDPLIAMRYSYFLSRGGTDFTPWGAYTNGSYKQFLGASSSAGTGTSPGSSSTSTVGFTDQFQPLLDWLQKPQRPVKMLVGIVLLGTAVYFLVSPGAQQAVTEVLKGA